VIYARAFFDLQLRFAHHVTVLSGLPLARVLLEYTNLYIRFGLGRDFDPAHPRWQEYVAGLQGTNDIQEWTYRFYLTRSGGMVAPTVVATSGCFSYARLSGERIRLHFQNAETDGRSPLAIERVSQRLAELAALFEHVKQTLRQPLRGLDRPGSTISIRIVDCFRSPTSPPLMRLPRHFSICPCGGNFWTGLGESRSL